LEFEDAERGLVEVSYCCWLWLERVRKRSRRTWWRSVVEGWSWVVSVFVLVGIPVAFGCDALGALVGLPLLLTILTWLLGWSLGSWVLGWVEAAWIWAYWNGLLSSSVRLLGSGGVIVIEESAFSVDVMARAPTSSPAFLLRELIALLALAALGFS
jgi:hypothetical protein